MAGDDFNYEDVTVYTLDSEDEEKCPECPRCDKLTKDVASLTKKVEELQIRGLANFGLSTLVYI